jgi:hypothetical protein
MAIRSIAAGIAIIVRMSLMLRVTLGGWLDGVLIPRVGICSIDHPLVFKAAAGASTLPRLKLLRCGMIEESMQITGFLTSLLTR